VVCGVAAARGALSMAVTGQPPEVERWVDGDMGRVELRPAAGGSVAVITARSPAKDTRNEDSVAVIRLDETGVVLALADGVGGLPSGAQASDTALAELARALSRAAADGGGGVREAILDGFENANRAVMAAGSGATTLAVCEVRDGRARSYHVGDSLIVLSGQRGKVKMQAIAHSPVGYAVESGLLDADDAMHHEDRHLIDNVIGSSDMRIEIGPEIVLAPRDTLLLASDGLSDNLYPQEIVDRMRRGRLDRAAQGLFDECRSRMREPRPDRPSKPDDLSLIVYRPQAPPGR